MRISNKSKFSLRLSNVREVNKKLFFAFEGEKTEVLYFSKFFKRFKKNDENIIFFCREASTNPNKIIEYIEDVIENYDKIDLTYDSLGLLLGQYLKENQLLFSENIIKKIISKTAHSNNKKTNEVFNSEIIPNLVNDINDHLKKYHFSNALLKDNELENVIINNTTYDPDIDEISIIVDRDKDSFTKLQYQNVLKKCKERKISFYVTNPCIEFWFLLHHTNCLFYDPVDLIENKKIGSHSFVYNELKRFDNKYTKTIFDIDMYISKTNEAIENAKNYESNIEEIIDKIGTNIPQLLKKFL